MEMSVEMDMLAGLVSKVMRIEDTTQGTGKTKYVVRFRGRLYSEDSERAYDQLFEQLKPYGITPLFRWDGNLHAVLLVKGVPQNPKPSNPRVNLLLFIVTFFSVLLTGALFGLQEAPSGSLLEIAAALVQQGWPFAVSMLAILGAHEFGHYLAGRFHRVHVTLPYFIPLPLMSPFGTLGAFISMKEIPRNRKILLDIGIAGPLAGFIVAVPVLFIGLWLSQVQPVVTSGLGAGVGYQFEGNSVLYLLVKYIVFGRWLPEPASFEGLSPFVYWLRYFFTGRPLPLGGYDVTISPVAWAGWGGLLVTAMNLIPAGQLDGGHLMYVLFGRKWAQRLFPVILIVLIGLGFFWSGWFIWAALIFFFGRVYAEPLDQITPIDAPRKLLAVVGLLIFLLTFTPIPLTVAMF